MDLRRKSEPHRRLQHHHRQMISGLHPLGYLLSLSGDCHSHSLPVFLPNPTSSPLFCTFSLGRFPTTLVVRLGFVRRRVASVNLPRYCTLIRSGGYEDEICLL